MTKRRNLDRERLEVYLAHLLLAYRPIFQTSGWVILVYSVVAFLLSPVGGSVAFGVAIFLVLLSSSYEMTVYLAKVGAWIGTLGRHDD